MFENPLTFLETLHKGVWVGGLREGHKTRTAGTGHTAPAPAWALVVHSPRGQAQVTVN